MANKYTLLVSHLRTFECSTNILAFFLYRPKESISKLDESRTQSSWWYRRLSDFCFNYVCSVDSSVSLWDNQTARAHTHSEFLLLLRYCSLISRTLSGTTVFLRVRESREHKNYVYLWALLLLLLLSSLLFSSQWSQIEMTQRGQMRFCFCTICPIAMCVTAVRTSAPFARTRQTQIKLHKIFHYIDLNRKHS